MEKGGLFAKNEAVWKLLPSLDLGIEWCEDQLLETADRLPEAALSLPRFLRDNGFSAQDAAALDAHFVRSRYATETS
jgi:hypothetical protein